MDRTFEVAGLLLLCGARLGIPIALTFLLAWGLRRLDARWQAEAEATAKQAQVKAVAVSRVNCWEMRNCSSQRRGKCPAFAQPEIPCWEAFSTNGHLRETCRDCKVLGRSIALAGF